MKIYKQNSFLIMSESPDTDQPVRLPGAAHVRWTAKGVAIRSY
jgi:hypothetical protein